MSARKVEVKLSWKEQHQPEQRIIKGAVCKD